MQYTFRKKNDTLYSYLVEGCIHVELVFCLFLLLPCPLVLWIEHRASCTLDSRA